MTIVIRASSTSGYLDCQLRAATSQLGRLFEEHGHQLGRGNSNVGALIGSGVHKAGEVALVERMMTGNLTPLSAMEDAGLEEFRTRLDQEGGPGLVMDDDSPTLNDAERQVRRMAARYREDVVTKAYPIAVENRIEAATDVEDVTLSGQADLLHLDRVQSEDGADDSFLLRDTKTSRRPGNPFRFAAQLGSYSLLYRTRGFTADRGQIDSIQRVKLTKPQPPVVAQPFDLIAAEQVATAVLHDFGTKAVAFRKDGNPARFLANPSSQLCSPKFCRAWGSSVCPATRDQGR